MCVLTLVASRPCSKMFTRWLASGLCTKQEHTFLCENYFIFNWHFRVQTHYLEATALGHEQRISRAARVLERKLIKQERGKLPGELLPALYTIHCQATENRFPWTLEGFRKCVRFCRDEFKAFLTAFVGFRVLQDSSHAKANMCSALQEVFVQKAALRLAVRKLYPCLILVALHEEAWSQTLFRAVNQFMLGCRPSQ